MKTGTKIKCVILAHRFYGFLSTPYGWGLFSVISYHIYARCYFEWKTKKILLVPLHLGRGNDFIQNTNKTWKQWHTCQYIETTSIRAITLRAKVLSTAHMRHRVIYIARNTPRGAKYPPFLFVPVDSRIMFCNVCVPAYAWHHLHIN